MSESSPKLPEFSLSELAQDVLDELQRRLGDKDLRAELPGTGLIKLAETLIKLQEKEEKVKEEAEHRPLHEVLADAELPLARKVAIAEEELDRLNETREGLVAFLEGLHNT